MGGHGGCPQQRRKDCGQEGPYLRNGEVFTLKHMFCVLHQSEKTWEVAGPWRSIPVVKTGLVGSWLSSSRPLCLSFCICKMGILSRSPPSRQGDFHKSLSVT